MPTTTLYGNSRESHAADAEDVRSQRERFTFIGTDRNAFIMFILLVRRFAPGQFKMSHSIPSRRTASEVLRHITLQLARWNGFVKTARARLSRSQLVHETQSSVGLEEENQLGRPTHTSLDQNFSSSLISAQHMKINQQLHASPIHREKFHMLRNYKSFPWSNYVDYSNSINKLLFAIDFMCLELLRSQRVISHQSWFRVNMRTEKKLKHFSSSVCSLWANAKREEAARGLAASW